MTSWRLANLVDLEALQQMAQAHWLSAGIPIGIVDAHDGAVLVGAGWQELCVRFHRANARALVACQESDLAVSAHLVEEKPFQSRCKHGLWDIGLPIVAEGHHLATLFLGQFFYEGETPDRAHFVANAEEYGFELEPYLAALAKVPVLSRPQVERCLEYDKGLVRFVTALAERSMQRARDGEARSAAEVRLRESEERYRLIAENTSDGIVCFDGAQRVTFVSAAYVRQLGYTEAEEYARGPEEVFGLVHPDEREALAADIYRAIETRAPSLVYTYRARHADGHYVWREDSARFRFEAGPAGRYLGAVVVCRDVSARKQAEAELARLEARLRQSQKMESIGRLASGIAHDFNNLLTVVASCAGALQGNLADGVAPSAEDVEDVAEAGRRGRDLTRQLLAFARQQVFEPVPLDLDEVVGGTRTMLGRLLGEGITLQLSPMGGLWPVVVDSGLLEQVVVNLAVNARDAMPEGGRLEIETRNVPEAEAQRVLGAALARGDWVRLRVRDTGIGMSPEVKARLFEPYFTTKAAGQGTGLGLATVYGIAQQAGGHLHVESAPGRGSTFELYLPRSERPVVKRARPAPARPGGGTESILVVEDDPQVRAVTARELRSGGYRVAVAESPEAALALEPAALQQVRLLVTDVVMPGQGGRALAEELGRRHAGLRALFVSGYASDPAARLGAQGQGPRFLAKPFTGQALRSKVREILDEA